MKQATLPSGSSPVSPGMPPPSSAFCNSSRETSPVTPQELKKSLVQAGFEVYRTTPAGIVLAERVRENQIMDAGIRVSVEEPHEIQVRFRAEKHVFPGMDDAAVFAHITELTASAVATGFREARREVVPQMSPSDREVQLDTFLEIYLVQTAPSFEAACQLARAALGWERAITSR